MQNIILFKNIVLFTNGRQVIQNISDDWSENTKWHLLKIYWNAYILEEELL